MTKSAYESVGNNAVLRHRRHDFRERSSRRIRAELGHDGPHIHYRVDSEHRGSRSGRRALLRFLDTVVSAPGGREECSELLRAAWRKKEEAREAREAAAAERQFST